MRTLERKTSGLPLRSRCRTWAWHGNTPQPHQQRGDASRPFPQNPSQPFANPLGDEHSAGYAGVTLAPAKKSRVGLALLMLGVLTAGAIAFGVVKATEQQAPESSAHCRTKSCS